MSSPIPTNLAVMQAVRDLVEGITAQEYSDEKVTESLMFGNSEVCLITNKFDWEITDKQFYRAREAANFFAASNLIPKTIRDNDGGTPLYITYRNIGIKLCEAINEGLPTDDDEGNILIIAGVEEANYYKNRNKKPFMSPDAPYGEYDNQYGEDWSGYERGVWT